MELLQESGRRPKPDGEPGWILSYDPDQRGFKDAFVVIVFCGIYLEALLHLLIVQRHGDSVFKKYDRKSYGEKLSLLGCTDSSILSGCKHYQVVRREIVHEKAHSDSKIIRWAQDEASKSAQLIESINTYLKVVMS